MNGRLRVLTLNTWLLRAGRFGVAHDLDSRAGRIPSEVARTGADVVALQEVWTPDVADGLLDRFRDLGYLHAARGSPAVGRRFFGDGLLVVSRFPLASERRLTFARTSVWFESFIAKGALAVDVLLPWGEPLQLATAHLGVVRFDFRRGVFREDDARTRQAQLEELVGWLDGPASPGARHLVLAGDLNVLDRPFAGGRYQKATSPDYEALLGRLRLADGFRERHPSDDGFTFHPATNAYAARGRCRLMPGERIDYVLHRAGTGLSVEAASLVFCEPPLLSDHYGVLADLRFD